MDNVTMLPVTFSILGFAILGIGLLVVVMGLRLGSASEEARRLERYVAEPAQAPEPEVDPFAYRRSELQGSFRQRLLLPWFQALGGLLGRGTPARSMASLGRQLLAAGSPLGLGPREFYGIQLLFLALSFWVAFTIIRGAQSRPALADVSGSALSAAQPAVARPSLDLTRVALAGITLLVGARFPKMWLRGRVRGRQNRIRKNLPDALDMLSVCADAGLGFDQALQRVSERWKTPLGLEFARLVSEMQMGLSRSQALRNMADRLDVNELSSFVAVIIQSDKMGMSITDTLRSQAEQMRVERRHRAQEEARKAPLKMLFPMLFLILPSMLAVVIGPTIPSFMRLFETMRNVGR
jgi:tight adherence protein C